MNSWGTKHIGVKSVVALRELAHAHTHSHHWLTANGGWFFNAWSQTSVSPTSRNNSTMINRALLSREKNKSTGDERSSMTFLDLAMRKIGARTKQQNKINTTNLC